MPNINAVVNDQIRRLSRREIKANTKVVRRATAQFRRDIAALKRQVATLTRELAGEGAATGGIDRRSGSVGEGTLRAMGVRATRARLGLSAKDYGKLVGVSELTIYHWEQGKARPRNKQTVAKWLAVRGLGKREAMERLGLAEPKAETAKPAAMKQRDAASSSRPASNRSCRF